VLGNAEWSVGLCHAGLQLYQTSITQLLLFDNTALTFKLCKMYRFCIASSCGSNIKEKGSCVSMQPSGRCHETRSQTSTHAAA